MLPSHPSPSLYVCRNITNMQRYLYQKHSYKAPGKKSHLNFVMSPS